VFSSHFSGPIQFRGHTPRRAGSPLSRCGTRPSGPNQGCFRPHALSPRHGSQREDRPANPRRPPRYEAAHSRRPAPDACLTPSINTNSSLKNNPVTIQRKTSSKNGAMQSDRLIANEQRISFQSIAALNGGRCCSKIGFSSEVFHQFCSGALLSREGASQTSSFLNTKQKTI
jgi:hypothetical protein